MTYSVGKLFFKRHKKNPFSLLLMASAKRLAKKYPQRKKEFTHTTTSSQRKPDKDDEDVNDGDTDLVG